MRIPPGPDRSAIVLPDGGGRIDTPALDEQARDDIVASTRETVRLVRLAVLPPGWRQLPAGTPGVPAGGIGTPVPDPDAHGQPAVIDTAVELAVPLSLADSAHWVRSHSPAGASAGITETAMHGTTVTDRGFAFFGPDGPAWIDSRISIEVTAAGPHSSTWRLDGIATWTDPRPVRDEMPAANRLAMTVRGGCPASDRGNGSVVDTGSGTSALLPDAVPTGGLICHYGGANGRAFALSSARVLTGPEAAALARAARVLPLGADVRSHGCAMDDESAAVVALSYPGRADALLWVKTSGCPRVASGALVVTRFTERAGPPFLDLVR